MKLSCLCLTETNGHILVSVMRIGVYLHRFHQYKYAIMIEISTLTDLLLSISKSSDKLTKIEYENRHTMKKKLNSLQE